MLSQAPRELLRLVSLRGPQAGLVVDLAPSVPDSVVVERMNGHLHLLGQPELVKRVVDPIDQLTDTQFDETSLRALRNALEQVHHLDGLTIDLGRSTPVPIGDLPGDDQFRRDLFRAYDSWLAQRITAGSKASMAKHVSLLRAAAVILEWNERPQQVQETPLTTWLNLTVIMTPRSWTHREQSKFDGPTRRAAKPNAPKYGRNARALELRTQMTEVTTGLEAMPKVANAVVESRAVWERSQPTITYDPTDERDPVDPDINPVINFAASTRPPISDETIRARLTKRLDNIQGIPAGTRTKMGSVIDGPGEMNELYENLGMVVDAEDPDLCAEIQVLETAILYDLPPAPNPTKPERPPLITTIGLGDLVVARERLVGYEAHEIAHIENVLPGESKRVENELRHRFETTTEDETTTENESQTDTDTTNRDATHSQTQNDLSNSLAIDGGVNVSSKYGATKIDSSLDVQFQRSLSESKSNTTDTVNEAITRTMERDREVVRNLRRTVTLDETRLLSLHEIDNTAKGTGPSPEPISGVYRWVENETSRRVRGLVVLSHPTGVSAVV